MQPMVQEPGAAEPTVRPRQLPACAEEVPSPPGRETPPGMGSPTLDQLQLQSLWPATPPGLHVTHLPSTCPSRGAMWAVCWSVRPQSPPEQAG